MDEYDDDEKYWYQTRLPKSDIFDDTSGFADLLSATKTELASLNKTRLDLVEEDSRVLDVQSAGDNNQSSSVDQSIADSSTLLDESNNRHASRSYKKTPTAVTSSVQSARYGLAKISTTNKSGKDKEKSVLSTETDDIRRYNQLPSTSYGDKNVLLSNEPRASLRSSNKKASILRYEPPKQNFVSGHFNYASCVPYYFYNPHENETDPLDYKRIVVDLLFNRTVDLMRVQTKSQKEKLIRMALQIGDGSVITQIVLHLRMTMAPNHFYALLKGKSWLKGTDAQLVSSHYVKYLKLFEQPDVVTRELQQLNILDEAMKYNIYLFNQSFSSEFTALINQASTNAEDVVEFVARKYKELLSILGSLKDVQYGKLISQHMLFLDIKKRLFRDLNKSNVSNKFFQDLVKAESPRSLVKFLSANPNFQSSGMDQIGHRFELFPQQLAFIELECIVDQGKWTELENLVISYPQTLGKRLIYGKHGLVPYDIVIDMASEAPKEVLAKFIKKISNVNARYELSEHYECYDLAVDILANELRDRARLDIYRRFIPRDHPAYMKAVQAISTLPLTSSTSDRKIDLTNPLSSSGAFSAALSSGAEMASGFIKKERSRFRDLFHRK